MCSELAVPEKKQTKAPNTFCSVTYLDNTIITVGLYLVEDKFSLNETSGLKNLFWAQVRVKWLL